MKNYYQILEIDPFSTKEEIKEQYRLLCFAWHPDRFSTEKQKQKAEEKLKEINEAYSILGKDDAREKYDSIFNKENNRDSDPDLKPSSINQSRNKRFTSAAIFFITVFVITFFFRVLIGDGQAKPIDIDVTDAMVLPTQTQFAKRKPTATLHPTLVPTLLPKGYIRVPYSTDFSSFQRDDQVFINDSKISQWKDDRLYIFSTKPREALGFYDPFQNVYYCSELNCDAIAINPSTKSFRLSFLVKTYMGIYEGVQGLNPYSDDIKSRAAGAWYVNFLAGPDGSYLLIVDDGDITKDSGFAVFHITKSDVAAVVYWTKLDSCLSPYEFSEWGIVSQGNKVKLTCNDNLIVDFDATDTGDTWITFGVFATGSAPSDLGIIIDNLAID